MGAADSAALRTLIIVNERSGGGAMADVFRRVEHRLDEAIGDFDVAFTDGPDHATTLTRQALRGGAERIIVAGGDGTVNEVVNGFFDEAGAAIAPRACLGLLAGGTGGDLRKTLRLKDMDDAIAALVAGHTRTVDVGEVTCVTDAGEPMTRRFLNIASFGLGGVVDRHVRRFEHLPGRLAYLAATVRGLVTYRNPLVRLKVDDTFEAELPIFVVAVANGRYFGGGMKIAPDAQLDDGRFHVTVMGDLSKWEVITTSGAIYEGAHVYHPKVQVLEGAVVEATSDAEVWLDIDGEPLGKLPATFRLTPAALKLVAPPA